MNNNFYENFDRNFEEAFSMSEKNFSHEELIKMLKNGNIPQKQIAALKFDTINSCDDANALLDNLTGCDGKIREASALKINQLLNSDSNAHLFFSKESANIFANASIDINANICRLVVDSAFLLKSHTDFAKLYANTLYKFSLEALNTLDKFIFRDKKYVINKQLFKLYWCLEGIKYFYEFLDINQLDLILQRCAKQKEYTIREKTAQIISKSNQFDKIKKILKTDENYYVRQALQG